MTMVLVLGISWGKLFKRGYTQDEFGVELAKRDTKIEELDLFSALLGSKN